jgi:hypothetical protein
LFASIFCLPFNNMSDFLHHLQEMYD